MNPEWKPSIDASRIRHAISCQHSRKSNCLVTARVSDPSSWTQDQGHAGRYENSTHMELPIALSLKFSGGEELETGFGRPFINVDLHPSITLCASVASIEDVPGGSNLHGH